MIKEKMKQLIGKSINKYNTQHVKDIVSELKFKEQYQGRIIDCMVGEVDDNYIETPETDSSIVKLEHSKEGIIKVPNIKGKTILVDADGNETDTPGEGCRLISVGEDRNEIVILSKNKNLFPYTNISINAKENQTWYSLEGKMGMYGSDMWSKTNTWIYIPRGYIKVTTQEIFNCGIQMVKKNEKIISHNGNSLFEGGYITFRLRNNDTINKFGYKNLMFEWSQSPILNNSSYIEPKQHKTEILLDEPLREINGFIQDEIVDNILYKNVGYKVIDSSLLTNMYIEVTNGYCRITTNNNTLNDWIGKTSNNNKDILLYREGEKITWKWNWNDSTIDHFYASNSNKTLSIIISQDKIDTMEGSDFREKVKKYFDKTKFEVFYNIKKIEELPNSITLQGFDDTTMYIENSITPTVTYGYNALIPYKEEVLNQQQEVETNTLDIEQNIIPYLMDMEFNLMLMEDE